MSDILNLSRLRCKEVISVTDGERIGFVEDIEINTDTGSVESIIVPSHRRFFFFFNRTVYTVPWSSIRRVGNDTVLVDWKMPYRKEDDSFGIRFRRITEKDSNR